MGRKKRDPFYASMEGPAHVTMCWDYIIEDTHQQALNIIARMKAYLKHNPDDTEMAEMCMKLDRANATTRDRRRDFLEGPEITMDDVYDKARHKDTARYFFYLNTLMMRMKEAKEIMDAVDREENDEWQERESEGL